MNIFLLFRTGRYRRLNQLNQSGFNLEEFIKNIDTGTYNDNYKSYKEFFSDYNAFGEITSSKDTTKEFNNDNYELFTYMLNKF